MGIPVQSYPELFTLLLGWQHYHTIWQLFMALGLPFLPMLGMLIHTLSAGFSGSQPAMGEHTLRQLEVQFFALLLVMILAAQPLIPLQTHKITYTPLCEHSATLTPGDSHTTYDDVFDLPTQVRIPLWWYAVLSVAQGINSTLKSALGCYPNVREMMMIVDETKIQDAALRQEAHWFYRQCFLTARAKLLHWHSQLSPQDYHRRVGQYIERYGVEDTQWAGSKVFLQVPGFYDTLTAKQPVSGFSVDPKRDWLWQQQNHASAHGAPTCQAWWDAPEHGLQARLQSALPDRWYARFLPLLKDKEKSELDKRLFKKASGQENSAVPRQPHWLHQYYAWLGAGMHSLFNSYPKLYATQQALVILRPLLLMFLILFLPFALLFTAYRIKSVVQASFLFFSIVLWDYLLHLTNWVDNALIKALYPNLLDQASTQAMITNLLINSLTIGIVLGWFWVMNSLGVAAGLALQGWVGASTQEAQQAGETAGNIFKNGVTKFTFRNTR